MMIGTMPCTQSQTFRSQRKQSCNIWYYLPKRMHVNILTWFLNVAKFWKNLKLFFFKNQKAINYSLYRYFELKVLFCVPS